MAAEDIVQKQDIAWIDLTVTAGVPTVVAKNGPISSVANNGLAVNITLGQGIPNSRIGMAVTPYQGLANVAGAMCSLSLDAAASTDTVKKIFAYADDRANPIQDWGARIVFSRVF